MEKSAAAGAPAQIAFRSFRFRWVAARSIYPAVMLCATLMHLALTSASIPVLASAYAAVAFAALTIAALEIRIPARREWKPSGRDVAGDLAYLALVQAALPFALGLGAGVVVAEGAGRSVFWPHAAPAAVQLLLMMLASDFFRYWLHVACHRYPFLWRLHSVHHSPEKLYWLNTGRFHPLEKSLQYMLEVLPFALLGVAEEVLALYFVLYAVNGFFQHANLDVRLGPLNYLVSGPELHRWHHSRDPEESRSNFGNNLILWDLLFGTRRLPRDREVAGVGVLEEPPRSPGAAFRIQMWIVERTLWRRFVAAALRPRREQMRTLRRILRKNRDTRFGAEHGFREIDSPEEYRRRVAVQDYESLRHHIEEQMRSGRSTLTSVPPCMYARTSGTTGLPKLVPVLPSTAEALRRRQALAAFTLYRARPEAYGGKILALVSPAVEGRLPGGAPFGSASGSLYRSLPAPARLKYVVPAEVFQIEDYELKYLTILRLALPEKNVTMMASANATTFLRLMEVLRERRRELLSGIERGRFDLLDSLPPEVRRSVSSRLACPPGRVAELRAILQQEAPTLASLWPHLEAVVTWTGGSAGFALDRLRRELPERTLVTELGYLASEVAATVNVEPATGLSVPALQEVFFEFAERDAQDAGAPVYRLVDELEKDREYYVLVTTDAGLYRYFMNDLVKVTGFVGRTPALAFVRKGRGITNVTGEKLSEPQVLEAVRRTAAELRIDVVFFIMLAEAETSRYRLLVESTPCPASAIGERVESHLRDLNLEYREKRKSGRLGPLEVVPLHGGAGESHKKWCLLRGQRESQFKLQTLQYAEDFSFPYAGQVLEGSRP